MTLLTILGGGILYQKKKDDIFLRDVIDSNKKEHDQLWDKKVDKEFMDHLLEEIKINREERREDMRDIRAKLDTLTSRRH